MNRFLRTILMMTAVAVVLAACSGEPVATSTESDGLDPASIELAASAGRPIADRYIVVFHDGVARGPALAARLVAAVGGELHYTYEHALNGFAATLPPAAVEGIRRNPNVAYVEQDSVVTVVATQNGATWGLDRVDQRALPLDATYSYENTGAGVTAYIIDTGILLTHTEFTGRLRDGFDAIDAGGKANDCNGHGTHVAGTVGGTVYGVAKGVSLVPVRVLNCSGSGTIAGVIAGVDWVTAEETKLAVANMSLGAVANMSLGAGASSSLDAAVNNSIEAGITYVVAAGNGNMAGRAQDACNYSPARVWEAITVGATTKDDAKTSWSNYGNCVDWFAPGAGITSAWHTNDTASNTISGTSMAAPHVAGAAALYLVANPGSTPQQVRDGLFAMATKNVVTSAKTTNNHLLFTLVGASSEGDGGGDGGGEGEGGGENSGSGFTLSAVGSKVKGVKQTDLTWSGTTSQKVDVYRDGALIAEVDGGTHTDLPPGKGGGTYIYKVCESGTTTCSNEVTVTF
jgi:subtilisin family serine protease